LSPAHNRQIFPVTRVWPTPGLQHSPLFLGLLPNLPPPPPPASRPTILPGHVRQSPVIFPFPPGSTNFFFTQLQGSNLFHCRRRLFFRIKEHCPFFISTPTFPLFFRSVFRRFVPILFSATPATFLPPRLITREPLHPSLTFPTIFPILFELFQPLSTFLFRKSQFCPEVPPEKNTSSRNPPAPSARAQIAGKPP